MPVGWIWENGLWRRGEVSFSIKERETPTRQICEDDSGPAHYAGSIEDVPLWHLGERRAYGKFAEMIEMEDELKHAYD